MRFIITLPFPPIKVPYLTLFNPSHPDAVSFTKPCACAAVWLDTCCTQSMWVQCWLRIMQALRLPELLKLIHSLTQTPPLSTASASGSKPYRNKPHASDTTAWLTTHGAVFVVLTRFLGSCRAVAAIIPALRKAAAALLGQLAHSFFMPFCLTATAVLARVQVFISQD